MANDLPVARELVGEEIAVLIRTNGLDNLTPKNIRAHLAQKFNVDFSDHRKAIDDLTLEKIKLFQKSQSQSRSEDSNNGDGAATDESSDESILDEGPKPTKSKNKKRRVEEADDDGDDDLMSRVKRRRGASAPKPRKTTKKPKDENAPKKRTAFTKICSLSDELTDMLGRRYMTRSDVVSCMWSYFRENDLMDPKDKRWVRCDSRLKDLCKKDRVLAFGVMKFMTPHITEAKFDTEEERLRVEHEVDEFQKLRKAEKEKGGKAAAASTSSASATATPDAGDELENSSVTSSSQDQADDENESQDTEGADSSDSDSGSGDDDNSTKSSGSTSADEESD